ncbi:MAG: hypothetical protein IJ571_04825 [Ruminococcus sp.]|nr:hypothetical protein [Ruminococcus sp.]
MLTLLAKSASQGLGTQGIIGLVLVCTGMGLIYFGIKIMQGYELFPQENSQNIPKEDNYVPIKAKVLQKKRQKLPPLEEGGEPRIFVQWKIGYEVDGEKYDQIVDDDDLKKGDFIDIKYDPDDPSRFYVDSASDSEVQGDEEENVPEKESHPFGYAALGIGLIIIALGVILVI